MITPPAGGPGDGAGKKDVAAEAYASMATWQASRFHRSAGTLPARPNSRPMGMACLLWGPPRRRGGGLLRLACR